MNLSDKVILTDADGVLLDWIYSFTQWMDRHNYELADGAEFEYDVQKRYNLSTIEKERVCRMFNESAWIRKLPPHLDAIKYVRKLHEEHGYVFRVISSLSEDTYAGRLRTKNLNELFGPTVFESFVYLDTGADKNEALEQYRGSGCFWIEDKVENYELGNRLGLESILIDHPFNQGVDARRACNWKEVYEIITGG